MLSPALRLLFKCSLLIFLVGLFELNHYSSSAALVSQSLVTFSTLAAEYSRHYEAGDTSITREDTAAVNLQYTLEVC